MVPVGDGQPRKMLMASKLAISGFESTCSNTSGLTTPHDFVVDVFERGDTCSNVSTPPLRTTILPSSQPERATPPNETVSAVSELCAKYYDLDEDCVGVDGILSLCDDLCIDPSTDVTILQIAWKFKQSKPLQFTRQEFEEGMSAVGADSIESLKAALPGIKAEFAAQSTFRDFYKFTFQASREGTNKTIEKEVAIALLGMVMHGRKLFHIHGIAEFLTGHRKENITADEWINFLEFGLQIKDDLSNYDEEGAWAVLVDDYAEWVKNGKKHE
jgi:DCN1-like protein 4/5